MERTIVISLDTEYFEFDYEDENVDNEDELYESAVDYFFSNVKIDMYQKGYKMKLFYKDKHCEVEVYSFFENKTALIFDPQQASKSKGNGWQIVAMKRLVPLEYVTNDMYMSKSKRNEIKRRLTLTTAIWTCTDGTEFTSCDDAIAYEQTLMENEEQKGFPMEKTIEHRVICDVNGFYCEQIRFLPLEDWDMANDGWRTIKVSSIPIKVKE